MRNIKPTFILLNRVYVIAAAPSLITSTDMHIACLMESDTVNYFSMQGTGEFIAIFQYVLGLSNFSSHRLIKTQGGPALLIDFTNSIQKGRQLLGVSE